MDWTIGRKMFFIGFVAVSAIVILAANSLWTNHSIHKFSNMEALRNSQISTVNMTLQAHLTLMLSAMDAIIDREEGDISEERYNIIDQNITVIEKNLIKLTQLADTEEEKKLAKDLQNVFSMLSQGIQHDLVNLIRESGARIKQIRNDFITMDDELDKSATPIEEALARIYESVSQEQKEAVALSTLRNKQLSLLNEMMRSHGSLMLAAMDSIIDKDEGQIDPDRLTSMNENISFMSEHLDDLLELSDTEEEKEAANVIKDIFPKLAKGIRVDLKKAIETRASQLEFAEIDDVLDNYGDPIEEELVKIYASISKEQIEATALSTLRNAQISLLNEMIKAHSALMLAAMDSIIDKDEGTIEPERLKIINETAGFISDHLNDLVELADTGEEKQLAQLINDTFPEQVERIRVGLLALIKQSGVELTHIHEAFTKIDDNLDEYGEQVEANLLGIQASVQKEVDEAKLASVNMLARSESVGWFVSLVILLVLVVSIFLISKSIIKPITTLTDTLKDISEGEGDLTARINLNRKDEIGLMANYFNQFVEKLHEMISNISRDLVKLSSTSSELSEIADELSNNSGKTSERVNSVSAASEEMTSNMNSVAAAMEQSSTNINTVATAAEEMSSTINEIAQNAENARNITENAVSKTNESTEIMNELRGSAEDIGKVVETIAEISEQVNLLSLNATIEAARAGEAGKGFAVVANEIKELAKQTSEASMEIKAKIDNIQEHSVGSLSSIKEISKVIFDVNDIVSTIASAVEEQSSATGEISQNISQASSGSEEVNANINQSSSVAAEISKDISEVSLSSTEIAEKSDQVKLSAEDLSKLAGTLDKMVRQFKI